MMENAKKQIELKRKQLLETQNKTHVPSPSVQTLSGTSSRIEQLKAQIEARAAGKGIRILLNL